MRTGGSGVSPMGRCPFVYISREDVGAQPRRGEGRAGERANGAAVRVVMRQRHRSLPVKRCCRPGECTSNWRADWFNIGRYGVFVVAVSFSVGLVQKPPCAHPIGLR